MSHDKFNSRAGFRGHKGYEVTAHPEDNFTIPSCGIEDVDRAIFELFDKHIKLEIVSNNVSAKVPVIFATGERFALVKRKKPLRDINGALILPLVSIRRSSIEQPNDPGMGMAQNVGEVMVKQKLSSRDPAYQRLVNTIRLKNQPDTATLTNMVDQVNHTGSLAGTVASRRPGGVSSREMITTPMTDSLPNNIFEIIYMPFPKFFTVNYEITFWSQYTETMNIMLEQTMWAYNAQDKQFYLTTDKGYYFVGYAEEAMKIDDNLDEFTGKERIIRTTINVKVPAYLIVPMNPGEEITLQKYMSAPQITFETQMGAVPVTLSDKSPIGSSNPRDFILNDVELLDRHGDVIPVQRGGVLYTSEVVPDPFSGKNKRKLVRVKSRNQRSGETTLSAREITTVDTVTF